MSVLDDLKTIVGLGSADNKKAIADDLEKRAAAAPQGSQTAQDLAAAAERAKSDPGLGKV